MSTTVAHPTSCRTVGRSVRAIAAALVLRLATDITPAGVALVETEPRLQRDIYAVQNAFGRKGSQFARRE